MRKTIVNLLSFAMLLGLLGCDTNATEHTTAEAIGGDCPMFMAGFGKTDITPQDPVPLQGYGDDRARISTGLLTYIEIGCLAITDERNETLLFLVADLSEASKIVAAPAIEAIEKQLGIPSDHIIISGTHTHSSVSVGTTDNPVILQYNQFFVSQAVEAARLALEDRKPAQVFAGSTRTENLNFVRRYIMDDGSLTCDGTPGTGTKVVSHESEADNQLQLLKFVREGKKDILVANYQAHPHLEGKTSQISAQTVGAFRTAVEKELDAHCLYWQGAAGNLRSDSRIEGETRTRDRDEYGKLLCGYVKDVYDSLEPVKTGPVVIRKTEFQARVNHTFDHLLTEAQEVHEYKNSGVTSDEAKAYAVSKGFNSAHQASRIVANASLPETVPMTLVAFSFGEIAGVVAGYEMFDTNGMYIKENSPFAMTFIVGYAHPVFGGYIPTAASFANGGYEVDNGTFAGGTGEELAGAFLDLLGQIHG